MKKLLIAIFTIISILLINLDAKNSKVNVDVYFEPFDSQGWQYILNLDLLRRINDSIDINVFPVINKQGDKYTSTRGDIETDEALRIYLIKKENPSKVLSYLAARSLNMTPTGWKIAAMYAGISPLYLQNKLEKNKKQLEDSLYNSIKDKNITSTSIYINGVKQNIPPDLKDLMIALNKYIPPSKKFNLYEKDMKVLRGPKFKVVYSADTQNWIDTNIEESFKRFFSDIEIEKIEYQKLDIKDKNKIRMIPAYLIEKTPMVTEVLKNAIRQGAFDILDNYYVYYNQNQKAKLTNREKKEKHLELFVMSQCPYGVMAENSIIKALKENKLNKDIKIDIHYIGDVIKKENGEIIFDSLHGEDEWKEDMRQIVIKKLYPDKYFDYLLEKNKKYTENNWEEAAKKLGLNISKIEKEIELNGKELLKKDFEYTNSYKITTSPTFILDGDIIFVGLGQLLEFEDYKNITIDRGASNGQGCAK